MMRDERLLVEVERGFVDVEVRAFRGTISIETNDHWCGSTESGFGAQVSMNLTREQAKALGEFLARKAAEPEGHEPDDLGAIFAPQNEH